MRKVPFIDSTGLHNLNNLIRMSEKDKTQILLSGVNQHVHDALKRGGIEAKIGKENICNNITEALTRGKEIISQK